MYEAIFKLTDPDEILDSCFVEEANNAVADLELLDFLKSKAYFLKHEYNNYILYANRCSAKIQNNYPELFAELSSMTGKACYYQGNFLQAIECYHEAIKYYNEFKELNVVWMMFLDIAEIYISIKQTTYAKKYLDKTYNYLKIHPETENFDDHIRRLYLDYFRVLTDSDFELASTYYSKLNNSMSTASKQDFDFKFYVVSIQYYHKKQNIESRDKYIKLAAEELLKNNIDIMFNIEYIQQYLSLLLNFQKLREFDFVCDSFKKFLKDGKFIFIKRQLLELEIEYFKILGDTEKYKDSCVRYYEYTINDDKYASSVLIQALAAKEQVEDMSKENTAVKRENINLQHKSQKDGLTFLNNRACFNEESARIFSEARAQKVNFGIEIIDIDFFKQYNDGYGHQLGDECIQTVAKLIGDVEKTDPQKITAYRYGGDEFVIIYKDLTQNEIERYMEALYTAIHKIKLEHKYSKVSSIVTLSQGGCYGKPKDNDTFDNYLKKADDNLYKIKQDSKDGLLVTQYKKSLFGK